MNRKIIFLITRADDFGGAQAHVLLMAEALIKRDYNAIVMAGGEGYLSESLESIKIRHIILESLVHPIRPYKDLKAYREIIGWLKQEKPDLLTTHSNKAGLLGRLAAKKLGIPVVFTSHGFLFSDGTVFIKRKIYQYIEMILSRFTDRVITVSESEFKLAVDRKVATLDKVRVIHNGLPDIGPEQIAVPAAQPPQLIMVARFAEPKDHRLLIQSLAGLVDQAWTLVLVGDGPQKADIEKLIIKKNLEDRVILKGSRLDVPEILAKSQLFILSSKREGFPLSILEAMRAGLPVLASDVGGVNEAIVDGDTGILYTSGCMESMRSGLIKLIGDPQLRQSMGRKGRNRYLEKFSSETMVEKTLAVYEELFI